MRTYSRQNQWERKQRLTKVTVMHLNFSSGFLVFIYYKVTLFTSQTSLRETIFFVQLELFSGTLYTFRFCGSKLSSF